MSRRLCGTRARYSVDRCRCRPCTAANRAYESNRKRQILYGRHNPFADATPVIEHVARLRAAGLGTRTIAARAGLERKTVTNLPGRARVRHETAAALLAVHADLDAIPGGTCVDATGTRRRIQALVATGWAQARIGERLGVTPGNLSAMLRRDQVTAEHARAVRAIYDDMWTGPPPGRDIHTRQSITRARNHATAHGWPPPMAWDDSTIDDSTATPDTGGAVTRRGRLPGVDEIRWLFDQGETHEAIAQRFGVEVGTVRTALIRANRQAVA